MLLFDLLTYYKMLTLEIINKSFLKEEEGSLQELQNLFIFFAKMSEWNFLEGSVNLILINDPEMQVLNNQYRQKNETTDVLSFPYLSSEEIAANKTQEEVLGEILISRDRAILDAQDLSITFQEELNKLLVHGVLHILGYDHIEDNDFLVMEKKEEKIIRAYHRSKKVE